MNSATGSSGWSTVANRGRQVGRLCPLATGRSRSPWAATRGFWPLSWRSRFIPVVPPGVSLGSQRRLFEAHHVQCGKQFRERIRSGADDDLILVEDIQSLSGEKEWYGWARQIGDRYFLVSVGPGCRCPSSTSESSDSEESSLSEESSGQGSESEPSDGSLSEGSGSGPSQGSFSEGSESQPSQGSLSEGSESQPSEEGSLSQGSEGPEASGSSKGTAIVPASWSPTGYTALFVEESPEVRFDDVLTATVFADDVLIPIDPKYLEVCAAGTVQVCGYATDVPVLIGAKVEGDFVRVKMQPEQKVEIVLRVTGLRKGFKGHRFPDRTQAQFESNERFINSAYDL